MEYLALLFLFDIKLVLRPREEINHFTDIPKLLSVSEDMIIIFSRLPNFNEMSKVMYLSLPLIPMCFLNLQQPQCFIFTSVNSPSVNVSSQNVFWVDQLW